jgi:glycosyltransferase involved in cell wall biosynthesis
MGRMAPGGTEHQLIGMIEAAHGRHWDATLCVLSSGWELTERVRTTGANVLELDGLTRADPRRARQFRKFTAEADVVHASLWAASAFARMTLGGGRGPALVMSERGVEDHRHPSLRLVDRMLRPRTDGYIGNSSAVTGFIRRAHGLDPDDPRVVEIPNGLDPTIFHAAARSADPQRPRRLIGVGRLIPGKRFDLAISVLPELMKSVDVELVIVGDGPERSRLESLAKRLPVTFLGHLANRQTLADTLRSSDVLVMPSASEGYPNAVLEALACGLPVVASDIPGNRVAKGAGVTLVDDDPETWRKSIVAALRNGPVANSQVGNRVSSFDLVALRHLDVFEAAIDRKNRRKPQARHQPLIGTGSAP